MVLTKKIFFSFVSLFFFSVVPESEAKIKSRQLSSLQKATMVPSVSMPGSGPLPKQTWFSWLRSDLSEDMCRDGSYLRTCFSFNEKTCITAMQSELTTCWSRETIYLRQDQIRPRDEGVRVAYQIGQCAGSKIEKRFRQTKLKNQQCSEMQKWMGR